MSSLLKFASAKHLRRATIVVLVVAGVALAYWMIILRRGELGEKEGYAALQSAESDHRNDSDPTSLVEIKSFDGMQYDVAGISINGMPGHRIWLILNKTSAGGKVFTLPAGTIADINCAQVKRVLADDHVHPKVRELLSASCAA